MQTAFTPQEQQLLDRLREKYSGLQAVPAGAADEVNAPCMSCSEEARPASQAELSSSSSRSTSSVHASVCAHCHGTGTLVEIYNHRRLENFCKDCDGRGVRVFKYGEEVQPGATAGGGPRTSSTAAAPAGVVALHSSHAGTAAAAAAANKGGTGGGGTGTAPDGDEVDAVHGAGDKAAALQRDLSRIAARAALYSKERFDTLALLQQPHRSGAGDQEGRDQAARDLLAQLDLQLERLELARRKKERALERLTGGGGDGGGGSGTKSASLSLSDIMG
ncbi:hypothetical protein VOLCADRAFT_107983 [Volvox carteri f. nagariensis]|uniref:Uncharacterized protein n=1 Tax=Volvox carteri f. nagariensis TaxID=3068 RepID=D8UHK5_VOLCA|nr:uncharacterized protein VOLCADRAFT_107983 [Volvox carteri f. nagariensis]EFJ40759.1 hypothetical protein VOLCADRAFT_107983 [Volvox carteri f. nagariensis]|eukprot:XP_002958134.1 hypothetical protein VOLCADRAFT_107983 [Volvox carteri f. nagariensis]